MFSCVNNKPQLPNPVVDKEKQQEEKVDLISNFRDVTILFDTNTALISEGDSIVIVAPKTTGTFTGIRFETTNAAASTHIFSTYDFRLMIKKKLPNGIYSFSARVSKGTKDSLFQNIFNLTVNPSLIKEVKYNNHDLNFTSRQKYVTETPTFYGTKPVSFFVESIPDMPAISINNITGAITIQESILPGNYKISLTTKNSKGFALFSDILNVSVGGMLNISTNATSFNTVIAPIIISACGKCHLSYREYHTAFPLANNIYDRVSRPIGDPKKMPQGTTLTDAEIALFKNWIDTGKNP